MKKRLLAILLTICMVAALLPTAVFAAEGDVAQIGETSYATLQAAIDAAQTGDTVKLLTDIDTQVQVVVGDGKNITLDLNGKTISHTGTGLWNDDSWSLISVQGGVLTITGEGKLQAKENDTYAVDISDGGTCVIESGTFVGNCHAVYVYVGQLIVKGGTFWVQQKSTSGGADDFVLNCKDQYYKAGTAKILVTGGKFYGFNPGASKSENPTANFTQTGTTVANDPSDTITTTFDVRTISAYNVTTATKVAEATMGNGITVDLGSIEAALNVAEDGGTVKLLKDTSESVTYSGGKTLTLDLNGKTVAASGEDAFLNVTNGTVKVTGDGTVTGTATDILTATDPGKIEVESGTFPKDVTKYCAEGLVANKNTDGNTWTVGEVVADEDAVDEIKQTANEGTTEGKTAPAIAEADKDVVLAAAQSVKLDKASEQITTGEVTAAEATEAQAKLQALGATEEDTIYVIHEVYLDVTATEYNKTEGAESLTLEIEPKYNVIASTTTESGEQNSTNTVTLATGKAATVTDKTVEVSVELPSEFAGDATTAYITHEHGENHYLYKGTIEAGEDDNTKVLKFSNPNGFSKFKISLKAPDFAIERANGMATYATLAEAVADVENDEIIEVSGTNNETIYVGRTVTFTIKGTFTGKVVASNIYTTVNKTVSGDKITYTCVYTAPSVPVYRVVVNDAEGGKIKASANKAAEGATIVLTPVADDEEGELETLAVVDEDGNAVTLTKRANGTYSFVMPAKAVTVTGTFTIVADPEEPDEDEEPGEEEVTVFTDVDEDAYYAEAVAWAVANEITKGTSETTFSPDDDCTRAQVVTFLWRYAGKPEPTTTENPFTDVEEGTDYYKAILWAYENGITTGTSETTFSPDETCTRAQVVTFLWRCEGELTYEEAETFTDVAEDAYYAKAVAWAVHEWITNGTGDGQFSPDDTCTRGQVVTFLYRDTAEG